MLTRRPNSGGLGLTGGIADVGCLYDALVGIHAGLADDSILDKYSEIRIKIWREIIDPMSRENFRRLHDQDPEKARDNDEFFKMLIRAESDVELQRQIALVSGPPLSRVEEVGTGLIHGRALTGRGHCPA